MKTHCKPKTKLTPGRYPNRLRRLRIEREMTLKQVGDKLLVSPQAVQKAEKTGKGLSKQHWYALADLFEIDPRELETPETIGE